MSQHEEWKPIIDDNIKPMYEVSNFGRVRNMKTNHILKPYKNKQTGYYQVSLMCKDNKVVKRTIHRLVLSTFTDEQDKVNDKQYVVNHKNEIDDLSQVDPKGYNHVDNLEWTTYSGNINHALENGKCLVGQDAYGAKIDNDTVHDICRLLEKGLSYNDIIDTLDLGNSDYIKSLLIRIRTGKQWKSISQHYKIDTSSKLRRHDDDEIHAICRNFDNGIFSPKKIKDNIGSNQDYQSFKKLVWFIKNRKCYKNISDNYNWWKR